MNQNYTFFFCIVLENPSEGNSPTGAQQGARHSLPQEQAQLLRNAGHWEGARRRHLLLCGQSAEAARSLQRIFVSVRVNISTAHNL